MSMIHLLLVIEISRRLILTKRYVYRKEQIQAYCHSHIVLNAFYYYNACFLFHRCLQM